MSKEKPQRLLGHQVGPAPADLGPRPAALDLGVYGITVNCIAPGPFLTDLPMSLLSDAEKQTFSDHTALGRWGDPKELVGPALLLASDAGSYITGQTLVVDGGFPDSLMLSRRFAVLGKATGRRLPDLSFSRRLQTRREQLGSFLIDRQTDLHVLRSDGRINYAMVQRRPSPLMTTGRGSFVSRR